ncbi:MAG TPA: hypothetical protein VL970_13745 [Candidatus Acidoferrales bacterium]|nr:hypothetical protein [Candidatus Acidoferrales bacterium]
MKRLLPISLLTLTLTLSGCAWLGRHMPWHHGTTAPQPAPTAAKSRPKSSKPSTPTIVTPDESLTAKVLSVNTVGRFVVLNFPEGRMPKLEQHFFLYRGGLKAAEVKIVGPQQDSSIVADIISGDAQTGDVVRDQ